MYLDIPVYIHIYVTELMKREAMSLKEMEEGYLEEFRGELVKMEMM